MTRRAHRTAAERQAQRAADIRRRESLQAQHSEPPPPSAPLTANSAPTAANTRLTVGPNECVLGPLFTR
jgi:hypothetical protein